MIKNNSNSIDPKVRKKKKTLRNEEGNFQMINLNPSICTAKETIKKKKKKTTYRRKKMVSNNTTDKSLVFLYKQHIQLNSKKTQQPN